MMRTLRLSAASVLAVMLVVLVAACSGSASPTATPQPTENTGGLSLPTGLGGSGDILGGLGNLHGNPGLEAKLPTQVCGSAPLTMSIAPGAFPAAALGALGSDAGLLSGLGGTATFSFALAGPGAAASDPCDTTFFAIQVSGGADAGSFLAAMVASNSKDGGSSTTTSLGGKNVTVVTDSGGSKTYGYVNGDTVFAVQADDDATAAAALSQLP